MEAVVLTIHLILALLLIGVVLLQRNEGAGLLSGGGSMSARGQATPLTKLTWLFAVAFICTSITLTIFATRGQGTGSVIDGAAPVEAPATPALPGADLLPPSPAGAATDAPATPPRADAPAPADPASPAAPATTP